MNTDSKEETVGRDKLAAHEREGASNISLNASETRFTVARFEILGGKEEKEPKP